MKWFKLVVFGSMLLLSFAGKSQSKHYLSVKGKAYKDSVVLRWDPSSPRVWEESMKNGFNIDRYTLVKNGVVQQKPKAIRLTTTPLLPWPMEAWGPLLKKNEQAGFAAAAIYGGTFKAELGEDGQDLTKLYNKAELAEARFGLAVFSVHLSKETSIASALRFTDKQIRKGERYLYKIYTTVPKKISIDTGYFFIDPAEINELPKVRSL